MYYASYFQMNTFFEWKALEGGAVCCVHDSSVAETEKLYSLSGLNSWNTLKNAAKITQYLPILEIASTLPEDKVPYLSYHRKCRSIFTMKSCLDRIQK